MSVWSMVYNKYDPEEEGLRESLCTLGNGYFCTRGAFAEAQADTIHYPGTYIAGGYNRLKTEIRGKVVENEDLVNMPNWLHLSFSIEGGEWFNLDELNILEYQQELDLLRGILKRKVRFKDNEARITSLSDRRFISMEKPHLAAHEATLVPENWSGRLTFRTGLDAGVTNGGVARYRALNSRHLEAMETGTFGDNGIYLLAQTTQSRLQIAQSAITNIYLDNEVISPERETMQETGYILQLFDIDIEKENIVKVSKTVSIFTSRDPAISEIGLDSRREVERAGDFDKLLSGHTLTWDHLWQRFDITFEDRDKERTDYIGSVLHLHTFHLLQTASLNTMAMDLDVGIPSRGWHGEAYRGHVQWDEMFIFPVLNLRLPEITKNVLMYRYRRLEKARHLAKDAGFLGAMYPWQSGSNGKEESQKIHLNPKSGRWIPDNSNLQRHVNAAVAYNIYQYYQATRDMEFLSFYGAEMMLEIARFWGSISTYNTLKDRYEIRGVMGPDEYHEGYPYKGGPGLNNNAYTNFMAVWVLEQAMEIMEILPEDISKQLKERLQLGDKEQERWRDITSKMYIPFHDNGIISQFEEYESLEDFDWEKYREKYGDIQRLDRILESENETPNRYKASKQADVLMLFYLFSSEELSEIFNKLGYPFDYETIPRNIDYYIERTSHGSTLSWMVHAWVLGRRDRPRSWDLYNNALQSDICDIQGGTTPEGIHLGAMAGTIDQIQRGYTGIVTRDDVLWFNPCLPDELESLDLQIRYRGYSLNVSITKEILKVEALQALEFPVKIGCEGKTAEIIGRDTIEFDLSSKDTKAHR
jgi:alpha,alpha-trehalase